MEKRYSDLSELKLFTHKIDKEMTMILQSLQWNRCKLIEEAVKETCRYDANHKIPPDKKERHEQECFLSCQGYSKQDKLLPDPLDPNANTLVKLNTNDITQIIDNAKKSDPQFKSGPGAQTSEPCTVERLQATYSADERRAIHDAVVEAVPFCHDLTDLALPSGCGADPTTGCDKSRVEILAELRDMKRRRTKYRVAAKSRNYSDVLRDVIKTQMELYTEVQTEAEITIEPIEVENDRRHASSNIYSRQNPNNTTDKDGMDHAAYQKYDNYKRERCIEDRQTKEPSRYYLHEDQPNTYKDKRHNEFHRRDEFKDKYQTKSNRESRNDDHYRSKYNKQEGDGARPRDERYDRKHNADNVSSSETRYDDHHRSKHNIEGRDRNRSIDERHERKYNADNVRDKYDKYQNKASSSKDYRVSHKSRDDKYKDKKAYDSREIKEEGKYKRYYDDRTKKDDKSKRTKYS